MENWRFDKKSDILEYLGRNKKDYRIFKRLKEKGVIIERDGRYITRTSLERKEVLRAKEAIERNKYLEWVVDNIVQINLDRAEKGYLWENIKKENLRFCIENELEKYKKKENRVIQKWYKTEEKSLYDHETRIGTATDRKGENNL